MGVQERPVTLEDALARAQRGNLIYAEILARKVLEINPNSLQALNLLGFVAIRAGLMDEALAIFRRAHGTWPQAGLDATLARLEPVLPAWRARRAAWRTEERFLLIKAWGYGFCSDLASILGSLLLAELGGRTPVVHWGPNSLYSDGSAGDCFRHYFEPVNDRAIADVIGPARHGVFPGKWNADNLAVENLSKFEGPDSRLGGLYFLHREEPVAVLDFNCSIVDIIDAIPEGHPFHGLDIGQLYRALWRKYLTPTPRVTERVESFAARAWPPGRVVAVHVRDGDHRYEQQGLFDVNAQYFEAVDRQLAAGPASIYLMTDAVSVVEAFRQRYGDRIFTTDAQRTKDDTGIHYQGGTDKIQLGVDILSDVLLALRADAFVGNGRSNPSCTVYHLKDWAPGAAHFIVPSFHEERNVFLYDV